jgi:hypothetical protein
LANGSVQPFNPYQTDIADTALVSTNAVLRTTLFFNKIEQIFGGEWTWQQTDNKQVLASGYESRSRTEQELKLRYNPSPNWTVTNEARLGKKSNDSQLFNDRDYSIDYYGFAPKLTWIYRQKWRITGGYEYNNALNRYGNEKALSNNFTVEGTFAQAASSSFSTKISAINMNYTGLADTPVGFALLEGLQNGQNLLWTITWERAIGKNLQLSVSYDGRRTGSTAPLVHVGRMQLRAIF